MPNARRRGNACRPLAMTHLPDTDGPRALQWRVRLLASLGPTGGQGARLDALSFHLCGLSRDDTGYVLETLRHRQATGSGVLRPLPHQRPYPCLDERSLSRGHRRPNGGLEPMRVVEDPLNRETIQAITQLIVERFEPEQVILFGSCARGEADENSDLDLMVVLRHNDEQGPRWLRHSPRHCRALRAAGRRPDPFKGRNRQVSPRPQLHDQPHAGILGSLV